MSNVENVANVTDQLLLVVLNTWTKASLPVLNK